MRRIMSFHIDIMIIIIIIIDCLPLHPKNKLKLYSRYALLKAAWHFTVADLSKTWVTENLDSLVSKYAANGLISPSALL